MKNKIITISRQYGSGGEFIGERLSEDLGIPCYDKQLIMKAASQSGIQEAFFEEAEKFGLDRYFSNNDMSIIKTEPLGDRIFLEQFKIIRNLAEEGPCIIIGRGSNKILWDFKSVLHVFIYADMSFRKNHIIETYKLPEQDVEKLIRQADRRRKTYLYEYTNQIWGEPQNYNICIDCGRIGIENTVRIICKLYLGE